MNVLPPPDADAIQDPQHICKTCANTFQGRFCNRCGEKVIAGHERSIMYFLEGSFHTVTHIDGKIFRNLKLILLNPGMLSKKYAQGIRQPFMKPIPMFFVANLIYFLLPIFETFNTSFHSQMRLQAYSDWIRPFAAEKIQKENISEEAFALKYNTKTSTLSKLLLIIFVPMFALVFAGVNYSRDRYFADHMLLALEFMCFVLFYTTIAWSFLLVGFVYAAEVVGISVKYVFEDEWTFLVPMIFVFDFYYLIRAERTFYDHPWWRSVISGAVILAIMPVIVLFYRFLLFQVTMLTI
jgi:hypothetical protein